MFNKESGLVNIWYRWIKEGKIEKEKCPHLSNLKVVVFEMLYEDKIITKKELDEVKKEVEESAAPNK